MKMKCLNFKKKYKDLLIQGKKIATLRMGEKNYRKGEIVKVVAGGKVIGKAKIIDVKQVTWQDIGKKDILMEGMKRRKDLEKELKSIYGNFEKNEIFTQIVFEMLKYQ